MKAFVGFLFLFFVFLAVFGTGIVGTVDTSVSAAGESCGVMGVSLACFYIYIFFLNSLLEAV